MFQILNAEGYTETLSLLLNDLCSEKQIRISLRTINHADALLMYTLV